MPMPLIDVNVEVVGISETIGVSDDQAAPKPISQIGIIRYRWEAGKEGQCLRGEFALPSFYQGRLSLEVGEKVKDAPGTFGGTYEVTTYDGMEEAPGAVFATGVLTLSCLMDEKSGQLSDVYTVVWKLIPSSPSGLGFVEGTALLFQAVGMAAHDQSQLVIAWDNGDFSRMFSTEIDNEPVGFVQHGIYGAMVKRPAGK